MRYTAKQIIERAKALAGMKNTSFLSYRELNDYLNLVWKQTNQALINKGCKYFLREVEVSGNGEYTLPWDFYQMESIRSSGGMVLKRHTSSMSDGSLSYDIIGNTLRIYGGSNSNLTLCYWTTPQYLSFPSDEVKLENVRIKGQVIGCGYNYVYTYYGKTIHALNVSTGLEETVSETLPATPTLLTTGKNTIAYTVKTTDDEGNSIDISLIQLHDGSLIKQMEEGEFVVKDENGILYIGTLSDDMLTIKDFRGNIQKVFGVIENPTAKVLYWNRKGNIILGTSDVDVMVDLTNGNVYGEKGNDTIPLTWDDNPAFLINQKIVWYVSDTLFEEEIDVRDLIVYNPLKCDFETGYGYLTSDGDYYYVQSFVPDTELDFPNTLMFEYMSYLMAYYFVLKQNADTTSISSALQSAELAFFDSLDNGGTYTRITNAYGGGY